MFKIRAILLILFLSAWSAFRYESNSNSLADGQQPQIAIDLNGTVRLIFGNQDKIYCVTSGDNGVTFSEPQLVGEVKDMHLGMSRGPQLASSVNYSLVTAIKKTGTIYSFQLDHKANRWSQTPAANDIEHSAPEGLMNISADRHDNFYAVWLDIRNDRRNKIVFSFKKADSGWAKNVIVYKSPDSVVCACCRPSITTSQENVFIMFRNWLNGSRDLYLASANIRDLEFSGAKKLGYGTWKLNACPMDGGSISAGPNGDVHTVWQREGKIFYAQPEKPELQVGSGRGCTIVAGPGPVIAWQDGEDLKLRDLKMSNAVTIDKGSFVKMIRTKDDHLLCTWERGGKIFFRKL